MTHWVPQLTQDGSYTFFSDEFGETFHSVQGAQAEAFQKFADATCLTATAQQPSVRILDICYGLGYNTAAALETLWGINPTCLIELYGLELDPTVPLGALAPDLLTCWTDHTQTVLKNLGQFHRDERSPLKAKLLIGDARQTIQTLIQSGFKADAIFFDPFSPRRCPQLWTVEFCQVVAQCLAPDGRLSTYSRSAAVRAALLAAGLQIGTLAPAPNHLPHEWAQGTVAAWQDLRSPLSTMEQEHLHTRAAIPYRDPPLSDSAELILARHQADQRASGFESTSSWRRRWQIRG